MRHIYQIIFLVLCFSYISCDFHRKYSSNRTNNSTSRSIYELVQLRRNANRLVKLHRTNQTFTASYFSNEAYTLRSKTYQLKDLENNSVMEPWKASLIISGIAIGLMIVIVFICIVFRYLCYNDNYRPYLIESATSRKLKPRSTQYTHEYKDLRNFQRKKQEIRTPV